MRNVKLFEPITFRSVTIRNRIGVSPMCEYSSADGFPNDWHLVHLGSRAVGGAGLVMTEATAVQDIGRISPSDAGIWKDEQIDAWRRVTQFITDQGATPAVQLAHAGWKASTAAPWTGREAVPVEAGGWQPVGVTDRKFADDYPAPRALTVDDIDRHVALWPAAAQRAIAAGFRVIEIHAAHGYLFHSFLSPLSNTRTDAYGGGFDNRVRLLLRVVKAVRESVPSDYPLFVRLSCSDWIDGGWTIDDTVRLSNLLRDRGIDLIDCSSGGASPSAKIPVGPGYQTQFAAAVRAGANLPTAAVGMITEAHQAETILRTGQADMIFIAREFLRDPYWPRRAAAELGADPNAFVPKQYQRAW